MRHSVRQLEVEAGASRGRIPDGPSLLYFIRNGKAFRDPRQILGMLAGIADAYGGVASFKSGLWERTYLVSDPEMLSAIFTSIHAFLKYPFPTGDIAKLQALIGKGMLATHIDEEWRRHRQQLARNFTPTFVENNYRQVLSRQMDRLFAETGGAESPTEVNVSSLSILFSGRVMSEILSPFHPISDDDFMQIKHILDTSILEFHRLDFKSRAKPYKAALMAQTRRLYESYLANRKEDRFSLIAVMHQHFDQGQPLTPGMETKILEQILNMVVAGYETTSTTINWVVYLLANHPAIADRLYQEIVDIAPEGDPGPEQLSRMDLLNNVIDETMRLYSVLWFNIRYCVQPVSIGGVRFVKNARIMLLPFIANRNPGLHDNPDAFDPDRYLAGEQRPFFPFGHGPRVCIGKSFAELELKLFICRLLRTYRLVSSNQPKAIGGVLLQPEQDVRVTLAARLS